MPTNIQFNRMIAPAPEFETDLRAIFNMSPQQLGQIAEAMQSADISTSQLVEMLTDATEPEPPTKLGISDTVYPSSLSDLIDPWQHRAAKMRCRSCIWFVLKQNAVGRCRRHAPTMSGYPVVYDSDWCGDHKLDEAGQ